MVNPLLIASVMDASLLRGATATGGSSPASCDFDMTSLTSHIPSHKKDNRPQRCLVFGVPLCGTFGVCNDRKLRVGIPYPMMQITLDLDHTNTQHRNGNKHSQRINLGYLAASLASLFLLPAASYKVCPTMDA